MPFQEVLGDYYKMPKFSVWLDTLSNANKVLKIGVVGQVKAGKSSFLNSLIFNGDSVLPKASTPMAAGLTVLQYAKASTKSASKPPQ